MPLTIAHPAAMVPLRRSGLPFSALVVGSLAPDLEYLLHLSPTGHIGHTIPGIFIFCLPIGLISLLIVHRTWMPTVNALLNRVEPEFRFLPASSFGLICISILIGAFSHVAWDSFTHSYGWMVQHIPVLTMPLADTMWGTLRLFKLLQHASTLIGLAVAGAVVLPAVRTFSATVLRILAILVCTSVIGGIAIGLAKAGMPSDFDAARGLTGIAVVGSFVVFLTETTVGAVLWRLGRK